MAPARGSLRREGVINWAGHLPIWQMPGFQFQLLEHVGLAGALDIHQERTIMTS
jgi:hypothetical protein